jgi:uncharacterized protein (TIGR00369 family)
LKQPAKKDPMTTPQDTLAAWIAEEETVRARQLPVGITPMSEVLPRTGLQLMQGMMSGELHPSPIGRTMDFILLEVSDGLAVFQGTPSEAHFNPMGSVHGGWFATLLDSALGCAVHTKMPQGRAYTTADLSVKMVKAISPKIQRVRAIGEVLHCGRQLATAHARLVGPDGTLYAHATSTCLVFDIPGQSKS